MNEPYNQHDKNGLPIHGGFPEYYHTFTAGELSVNVGRNGGIDDLAILDIREANGLLYPDRFQLPLLSRSGSHLNRPMYGAAVKFISTDYNGVRHTHAPRSGRMFPFGFRSTGSDRGFDWEYRLLTSVHDLSAEFEIDAGSGTEFAIHISKYHLAHGSYPSFKDQMRHHEYGVDYLPEELLQKVYAEPAPFQDGAAELSWRNITFVPDENTLFFEGAICYPDQEKQIVLAVSASVPLRFSECPSRWELHASWRETDKITAAIACGTSRDEAAERVRHAVENFPARMLDALRQCAQRENRVPRIEIEALPDAAHFSRVALNYQHALLLAKQPDRCAIRAAAWKYGYFALWDHIYPIRDFIVAGEFDTAERLLRFIAGYPHMETMTWSVSQLVLELNELAAFCPGHPLLREVWPELKRQFAFTQNYADSQTGLVFATHCCGVDNPAELGLGKLFYASCINGWYYNACRAMENLALSFEEPDQAQIWGAAARKVEAHYLANFYHRETGYLRVAVTMELRPPETEVFHNSSTIALDYPYGSYLLRSVIAPLAAYKECKLNHANGYTAVSSDSASPCEMWQSVYMNQHLGHDCKASRLAGDSEAGYRLMHSYLNEFHDSNNAIETFNYDGCEGDILQRVDWQAFSATGANMAIWQALAGIVWHRGGLHYLGGFDTRRIRIDRFHFQDALWAIRISGKGRYVSRMELDGIPIHGTMQIPSDLPTAPTHRWIIERSDKPPERIVLLQAEDVRIESPESTAETLSFTVGNHVHGSIRLLIPAPVSATVNGAAVPVELDGSPGTAWIDGVWKRGDRITIKRTIPETPEKRSN